MSTYSTVSEAIESLTVLQNKLNVLSESVDGIARKLDAEVIAQEPDESTIADKTYINKLDENRWYNCSLFHFENLGFCLDNKNVLIVAVPISVNMNAKNEMPIMKKIIVLNKLRSRACCDVNLFFSSSVINSYSVAIGSKHNCLHFGQG